MSTGNGSRFASYSGNAAVVVNTANIVDGAVTTPKLNLNARPVQNFFANPYLCPSANQGENKSYVQADDDTQVGDDKYGPDCVKVAAESDGWEVSIVNLTSLNDADCQAKFTKETAAGKLMVLLCIDPETAAMIGDLSTSVLGQLEIDATPNATLRMAWVADSNAGGKGSFPNPIVAAWNANGVDPTFAGGVANTAPVSINAVAAPAIAAITGTPGFANIQGALAIWTDSQMAVGDFIQIKKPMITLGSSVVEGSDNRPMGETLAGAGNFSEKSYDPEDAPGDAAATNGQSVFTCATADHSQFIPFAFPKLKIPVISVFSPATGAGGRSGSTNERVRNETTAADVTPVISNIGTRGFTLSVSGQAAGNVISFHWVANAGV